MRKARLIKELSVPADFTVEPFGQFRFHEGGAEKFFESGSRDCLFDLDAVISASLRNVAGHLNVLGYNADFSSIAFGRAADAPEHKVRISRRSLCSSFDVDLCFEGPFVYAHYSAASLAGVPLDIRAYGRSRSDVQVYGICSSGDSLGSFDAGCNCRLLMSVARSRVFPGRPAFDVEGIIDLESDGRVSCPNDDDSVRSAYRSLKAEALSDAKYVFAIFPHSFRIKCGAREAAKDLAWAVSCALCKYLSLPEDACMTD